MYLLFPEKQIANSFPQMWKEAWRMDTVQEKHAQVTIEKSCQIINRSYILESPNKFDDANAMAHQNI